MTVPSLRVQASRSASAGICVPNALMSRIGRGRDAAKQYLKDNPAFAEKPEADIRACLAGKHEETSKFVNELQTKFDLSSNELGS